MASRLMLTVVSINFHDMITKRQTTAIGAIQAAMHVMQALDSSCVCCAALAGAGCACTATSQLHTTASSHNMWRIFAESYAERSEHYLEGWEWQIRPIGLLRQRLLLLMLRMLICVASTCLPHMACTLPARPRATSEKLRKTTRQAATVRALDGIAEVAGCCYCCCLPFPP